MKIKCSYCGNYFNDTLTQCPNCGAPNEAVVRTVKTQPMTIEELAKWYADRGLPPYETTRFFIGQDYRGKRAFGIYKDPNSGNFIVYKNKDSGERAIRYAGTDEAYAVNELFMRLKQEIIEQKRHNVEKRGGATQSPPSAGYNKPYYRKRKTIEDRGCLGGCLYLLIIFMAAIMLITGGIYGGLKAIDSPKTGYYQYEGEYMYFSDWTDGISDNGWIEYNPEDKSWDGVYDRKNYPAELRKNKTAQEYFLGEEWSDEFDCTDFKKSEDYARIAGNYNVRQGYYEYDDSTYYHAYSSRDYGWYEYDTDESKWAPVEAEDVPYELHQYFRADDFFFTPTWDESTQFTDFRDSEYYVEPSSSSDDNDSWWDNYDDDSSYDWDSSSDSWNSDSTDWDSDW